MDDTTYNIDDYNSGDGMLTSVWGPSLWHYLHTISFNYPVNPTKEHKKYYKQLVLNMKHTLPCSHCRNNLTKNLRGCPLTARSLKTRDSFSRWMFDLHENKNKNGKTQKKGKGLCHTNIWKKIEVYYKNCSPR